MAMNANGLLSPPQTEKSMSTTATPPKIVITEKNARILCVADIRGDCKFIHPFNRLHYLITRAKEMKYDSGVVSQHEHPADVIDHELNKLIREHDATAVIHTGDFGFLTADSLERMGDK